MSTHDDYDELHPRDRFDVYLPDEHSDSAPSRPSDLDYEADPLLRLERNNRSSTQAIVFFFGIIFATTISAIVIWVLSLTMGGPYCDRDDTAQLCSRGFQLIFSLVPTSIAMFGLFGGAFIAYLKWRRHERWRPWIAVVWFIMPFSMAWVTSIGAMLILGHSVAP